VVDVVECGGEVFRFGAARFGEEAADREEGSVAEQAGRRAYRHRRGSHKAPRWVAST